MLRLTENPTGEENPTREVNFTCSQNIVCPSPGVHAFLNLMPLIIFEEEGNKDGIDIIKHIKVLHRDVIIAVLHGDFLSLSMNKEKSFQAAR